MGASIYSRESAIIDGLITNVASGDLGDANTSFTYINLARDGMKHLSLEHIITATTLTVEMCNLGLSRQEAQGTTLKGLATATSAGGTQITDSGLTATFPSDTDLIGIQVRIIQDNTTPSNVGLTRTVTAYTGATGVMTLSSATGATTSGVTKYQLEDSTSEWGRKVTDPTSAQWRDVTLILTGAATHTASGVWFFDTDIMIERLRIRRLTTNAINALSLRLARGR